MAFHGFNYFVSGVWSFYPFLTQFLGWIERGWCARKAPLQNNTFNYVPPVCSDCTSKIGLQQQWPCCRALIGISAFQIYISHFQSYNGEIISD